MKKHVYVLGTGLSHCGSACLLKDGKIAVAIEKERITRNKQEGGNDTDAIKYCLEAEGITVDDLTLVVQNSNFGFFEYGNDYYKGKRLFTSSLNVPIVTISHHLAHAYYAIGTSPYDETAVLVLDGCGSLLDECIDIKDKSNIYSDVDKDVYHLYAEKDSFYSYRNNQIETIYKDFSPMGYGLKKYPMHPPTTKHSIGGVYMAASLYCFSNMDDVGKLMGLAPYGKSNIHSDNIFELRDDKVFVNYDWTRKFNKPARSMVDFWSNFQYYADIAFWVQRETERAILYLVNSRSKLTDLENLAYTGGVALNAVANSLILKEKIFKNLYLTPAAGDNGLAIGCAYYGWLEILKKEKVLHHETSCFGKVYSKPDIEQELKNFIIPDQQSDIVLMNFFFEHINEFLNKSAVTRDCYVIQFIFTDLDTYFIKIERSQVSRLEKREGIPDCVLCTDSTTFLKALKDSNYLLTSIRVSKSSVIGDFNYFLNAIRITEMNKLLSKLFAEHGERKRVHFNEEEDVAKKAASLLKEGKTIGWFQGKSEFGPRALGNRSILADPRKKDIQKFINSKIKFREDFRPFAPSVLEENVSEFFDFEGKSPFMIMVAQVRNHVKDLIPGVVHRDNTSRIQTVCADNEKYYKLIQEFYKLTGIPLLLNTSFNRKGMPIVETPVQALSFFYECDLDCLVIDDFIVYKNSPNKFIEYSKNSEQIVY